MVAPVGRSNLNINWVTVPGREPFTYAFWMIYQLMILSFDLHEMSWLSRILMILEWDKEKGIHRSLITFSRIIYSLNAFMRSLAASEI